MATKSKEQQAKDPQPRNKNEITLKVAVNGQPTDVIANVNAPLHTIIPEALKNTNNVGRSPGDWELKDVQGNLLDGNKKIAEYNFAPDVVLFLTLKAGVAGCAKCS